VIRVEGTHLIVAELDAINGTPVLYWQRKVQP
jgi:tRNA (Thr-GGU) A37 N-methylase